MAVTRYVKAIERNLFEIQRAILNRTTLVAIESDSSPRSLFVRLSYYAFFNDYIAHLIKALENGRDSACFWYIYRTNKGLVDCFAKREGISLERIEDVSSRLKKVRDKTHFHLDRKGIDNPAEVWRSAGIVGRVLSEVCDELWKILNYLWVYHGGDAFVLPEYPMEEVVDIVKYANERNDF